MKRLIERERKRVKESEAHAEYDAVVVTRWLQLIARQSALYNVNNRHQCFKAEGNIIRPFEAVPHFFGCVTCGRYHFCRGERASCEIYFSESERCELCLYSGRLLRHQDNLEADEYEEGVRASHRPEVYHIPSGVQTSPPKRKKWGLSDEQTEQIKQLRRAAATTTGEQEEEQPEVEEMTTTTTTKTLAGLVKKLTKKKNETLSEKEEEEGSNDEWEECLNNNNNEEAWQDEEEGEGGREWQDDRDGFNKNYHNNLEYNNRLFAFLWPVVHERKKQKPNETADLYKRDLLLSQQTSLVSVGRPHRRNEARDLTAVSDRVRNKIRVETELMVARLLIAASPRRSEQQLNNELVDYFAPLITRVTGLVYRSQRLREFAAERDTKSEKQAATPTNLAKLALSTIDLSAAAAATSSTREDELSEERAEQLLEPSQIVRAMLLFALVEPLAFNDSMGIRIDIWHRDPWLRHTLRRHHAAIEVERQTQLLSGVRTLLTQCLNCYSWCPLWLRATLFPARLVQFDSVSVITEGNGDG